MSKKTVSVQLSTNELALLANAVNEAREAVDEWEFKTRLGARPAEADELRQKLRSILDTLESSD